MKKFISVVKNCISFYSLYAQEQVIVAELLRASMRFVRLSKENCFLARVN